MITYIPKGFVSEFKSIVITPFSNVLQDPVVVTSPNGNSAESTISNVNSESMLVLNVVSILIASFKSSSPFTLKVPPNESSTSNPSKNTVCSAFTILILNIFGAAVPFHAADPGLGGGALLLPALPAGHCRADQGRRSPFGRRTGGLPGIQAEGEVPAGALCLVKKKNAGEKALSCVFCCVTAGRGRLLRPGG